MSGDIRHVSLGIVVALLASACDAQAPADYLGEPLGEVRGQVTGSGGSGGADAALLWWRADVGVPTQASRVVVQGEFPSAFTLTLYETPPPAVRARVGPARIDWEIDGPPGGGMRCELPALDGLPSVAALAFVVAVPRDATDVDLASRVVGVASEHVLLFLAEAAGPGTAGARWLGGSLTAGFHMLETRWSSFPSSDAIACRDRSPMMPVRWLELRQAPDDLDTAIEIRLSHGQSIDR